MEFNEHTTFGEKYGPAMAIQTEEEARAWFEKCVEHTMTFGKDRKEAEAVERLNIGYYTGYYDDETAERVMRLFNVTHPIFGNARA